MILKKAETFAYILMGILVLVGAVLGFLIFYQENKDTSPDLRPENDEGRQVEAETYTSTQYNFTVTVPDGWEVYEGEVVTVPAITLYPTEERDPQKTYDHFTNETHVSVYPQGIPTEGVFAQTRPLDVSVQESISDNSRAYMLDNGDIFARYILLENAPEDWNESGFMWTRLSIEDQRTGCITADGYTESEECDPLMGDEVVMIGEVETEYTEDIRTIVESFTFID